jgi:hypothetical protein
LGDPSAADREEPNRLRMRTLRNHLPKKSMKLAILGSPSFEDYARFTKRVEEVLAERGIMMSEVQVISCGADALAARYSREVLDKEPHIFTADWKQFGRPAGPKRDDQIVEAADLVIAFPGKGRGTWNTIYLAWKKGIPVDVFPIK